MTLLNILDLALLQGVTEFLPIRSSAHLDLAAKQTGWPDRPMVDAALHPGTLFGEGTGCP